jgi:hypothetical protein
MTIGHAVIHLAQHHVYSIFKDRNYKPVAPGGSGRKNRVIGSPCYVTPRAVQSKNLLTRSYIGSMA